MPPIELRRQTEGSVLSARGDLTKVFRNERGKSVTFERLVLCSAIFLSVYLPFRFSSILFTVSDLLYVVSLGILVLSEKLPLAPLGRATSLWYTASLLLFGGLLASSMVNGDPVRGFIVVSQYAFAYVLLMWVIVRDEDLDSVRRLVVCLVLGLLIIDLHGVYSFFAIGYVPGVRGAVTGGGRLATLLGNANEAAAMNAAVVPFVLYLWQSGTLRLVFAVPALALMSVTVILTSSNSGLASFVASVVVFAGLSNNRMFLRIAGFALVIALIFYFGGGTDLLPETFQRRVLGALATGDLSEAGTFVDRLALMKEAEAMILQHGFLLLGIGADQFRVLSVQGAPVHDVYLLVWAEGGLFALVGWLLFFVICLALGMVARTRRGSAQEGATLIAVALTFLVFAISNPHIYSRNWLTPVMLGLSLVMNSMRQTEREIWKAHAAVGQDAR